MDKSSPSGSDFETFQQSHIFQGLNSKEVEYLYSLSHKMSLKAGQYLIHEGEAGKDLYILINGSLVVTKQEPVSNKELVVGEVSPGQSVGDVSFLDRGVRAASVKAITQSNLRSIPFQEIYQSIQKNQQFITLFFRIAENITKALRYTNDLAIQELRNKLEESRIRSLMGMFFVSIVTVVSLFIFALSGLQYLLKVVPATSFVSIPLTLLMGTSLFFLVKQFHLPWKDLGITKENWARSVKEGFLFTLVFIAVGVIVKIIMIHFGWYIEERPFFDPFSMINRVEDKTWGYWIVLNLVYCFFFVPIQELLTRGGLQGILEKFLTSKYRIPISIFVSNLIFSSMHVLFSVYLGIVVFIAGLFLGWLYSRTHNLIGCTLAHAMMGVTGFSILGMAGFFFS